MSHFKLAVFTDNRPCERLLGQILAPYEETESNPNSKWDWWMIGGRWHKELIVKSGVNDCILGEPGIYEIPDKPGRADGAQIRDLDLNAMLEQSRLDRGRLWDEADAYRKNGNRVHHYTVDTNQISRKDYMQPFSCSPKITGLRSLIATYDLTSKLPLNRGAVLVFISSVRKTLR